MVTPKHEEFSPEELLHRLRAERARGPLVPPLSRQTLLGAAEGLSVLAEVGGRSIVSVVIITDYPAGPVSLVLTREQAALEFADGKTVAWQGPDPPPVRDELVDVAGRGLEHLDPTRSVSLPAEGRVELFVRTRQALLVADASESDLLAGRHPLAGLYRAALRAEAGILDATA